MANDVTSKVILGLDPSEFRRGIQQVDAKLKETSKLFSNLGQLVGASFAVAAIQNFTSESIALAREAEGVRNAFKQLNDPQILDNLREAVRGTVSDLELMKSANQAKSIGVDMQDLGKVMQYVSKYARATGQDMNQLMSDATLELVRQTGLRLDQLGISLVEVRKRMKETGDFTSAVLAEMAEKSAALGEQGETAAEKLDRLTATIDNQKTALGNRLLPVYSWFLGQFEEILNIVPKAENAIADFASAVMRIPTAMLGGLDQAAGGGMQGEQNFLMGRQNALAQALAAGKGPKAFDSGEPKKMAETLALLRGQLADYVAQLEQAEIGSNAFSVAKTKVEELTKRIKDLTEPAKKVFAPPTTKAIALAAKEMGSFGEVTVKAAEVLKSVYMPALQTTVGTLEQVQQSLQRYNDQIALGTAVGAEFGNIMAAAFNASMVKGTSFFEEMQNAIKNYVQQLAAAIATTVALSAVVSALTGIPIGTAFRGVAQGTGLGNIFGENGILNLNARVSGSDLLLGTARAGSNYGRSGG
jgi:hypothetical protein